jgi:hypothetical protein
MTPFSRHILSLCAALLTAVFLLVGCDWPGSEPEDPVANQTRILRVEVEPNPVAVGDTATFTCIIEDSTDERFRFRWHIEGEPTITTDVNRLQWIADVDPGVYQNGVRADNGSEDSLSVSKGFPVEVVESKQSHRLR